MVNNRSAPEATIVPILVYEDVGKALAWLCETFGFKERLRAEHDGVVSHAQLTFGDGAIMIGRQGGPFRAPDPKITSAYVAITVDDVTKHFEHSKKCGAHILQQPTDMPFGERQYTVQDLAGHRWTFSQHIADVAPEQWGAKSAE